jgi:uncharacterized protein YeaO (DUF488 family)
LELGRWDVAPSAGRSPQGVEVRRVYGNLAGTKGEYRVLVDRLWPRGLSKRSLRHHRWAKDVAPSTDLRRWYAHDPERFDEFSRRYLAELRHDPAAGAVAVLLEASAESSTLVLLTATSDVERSAATVLARHLRRRRRR